MTPGDMGFPSDWLREYTRLMRIQREGGEKRCPDSELHTALYLARNS